MKYHKIVFKIYISVMSILVISCETRNVFKESEKFINSNFHKKHNYNFVTGIIAEENFELFKYNYSVKEISSNEICLAIINKTNVSGKKITYQISNTGNQNLKDLNEFRNRLIKYLNSQKCQFGQIKVDSANFRLLILK